MSAPIGLILGSSIPPDRIGGTARLSEELGFNELWIAEDLFFTGGISGAAEALAATSKIKVGTGIVSAMSRHPSVLAMEFATLALAHPGRFEPGIGVGTAAWLDQIGLRPKSPMRATREVVDVLRRLLAGESVTNDGEYFKLDDVKLTYPLEAAPPFHLGVMGPKMLELSGEIAEGTLTSVFANVPYVKWARERIAAGQAAAGRTDDHRLTVFMLFSCDEDPQKARDALRPLFSFYLSHMPKMPMTDVYGIGPELAELAAKGPDALRDEMPAEWLTDLAVVGSPAECIQQVQDLFDAGADSVVLFPQPIERLDEMVRIAGEQIIPAVHKRR